MMDELMNIIRDMRAGKPYRHLGWTISARGDRFEIMHATRHKKILVKENAVQQIISNILNVPRGT